MTGQIERFRKTGLAEAVLRSATHDGENWIARAGYLLDKRPSQQYGILYDRLINAIRAEIPAGVESIWSKVTSISTSDDRQKLVLSNGEEISARLVVLANGLNVGLRRWLGIERRIVSACHSISLGFNIAPIGRPAFEFPALTYFSERTRERISLSDAVSDRHYDAGQSVCLSPARRSLAAAIQARAGSDAERGDAEAAAHHRRV